MSAMNPLEQYLNEIIDQKLKNHEISITKKDANEIVKTIIPEIDKLISVKVKEHFCSLAEHILEKFNSKE